MPRLLTITTHNRVLSRDVRTILRRRHESSILAVISVDIAVVVIIVVDVRASAVPVIIVWVS